MDNQKIGYLINQSRKEKNMTQKELADKLHVSDKTISKWETGLGCPDIASINDLAEILEVNVTEILSGMRIDNSNDMGNMKKTKFYVCSKCGNIITSTSELILNCCGKKLTELQANTTDMEDHQPKIEYIEDETYIRINHEMSKKHFISFIAYVTCDKLMINRLYPEQNAEVRFKMRGHGYLYIYCSEHGMWKKLI